jgi:hypothetical protein
MREYGTAAGVQKGCDKERDIGGVGVKGMSRYRIACREAKTQIIAGCYFMHPKVEITKINTVCHAHAGVE